MHLSMRSVYDKFAQLHLLCAIIKQLIVIAQRFCLYAGGVYVCMCICRRHTMLVVMGQFTN